jgi:hypothetical protein
MTGAQPEVSAANANGNGAIGHRTGGFYFLFAPTFAAARAPALIGSLKPIFS